MKRVREVAWVRLENRKRLAGFAVLLFLTFSIATSHSVFANSSTNDSSDPLSISPNIMTEDNAKTTGFFEKRETNTSKTVKAIPSLLQASSDGFEPDNNMSLAKEILINSTQNHSIYPVGDVDWVFFEINESLFVTIETSGKKGYDTSIALFDAQGNLLEQNDDGGDYLYSKIVVSLKPAKYYVYVEGFQNVTEIPSYNLTVSGLERTSQPETPGVDPYEPDDSPSSAVPIFSGDELFRSISPQDDIDWFVFVIDETSYVDIVTRGSGRDDTMLSLYDDNIRVIYQNDDWMSLFAEAHLELSAGRYYFSITSYGMGSEIKEYLVSFRALPTGPDTYENDDTIENATLLQNGKKQFHTIHDSDDNDYFKLVLDEESFFSFDLLSYIGGIRFEFFVLKNSSSYTRYVSPNEVFSLDAGVYYFRVFLQNVFDSSGYYYIVANWIPARVVQFDSENMSYVLNGTVGREATPPFVAFKANFSLAYTVSFSFNFLENGDDSVSVIMRTDKSESWFGVNSRFSEFSTFIDPDKIIQIAIYSQNIVSTSFILNVTAHPAEPDEYEPDDSSNSATKMLSSSEGQEHSLAPRGDVDWFSFEIVEERGILDINIEHIAINEESSMLITIYDEEFNTLNEMTTQYGYGFITGNYSKGNYYIEIRAVNDVVIPSYYISWSLRQKYINVIEPSGNDEFYALGDILQIKWDSSGVDRVTISLRRSSNLGEVKQIVRFYENTGEYSWKIEGVEPGAYVIMVQDAIISQVRGLSSGIVIKENSAGDQGNNGGGFFRISFQHDGVLLALVLMALVVSPLVRRKR